MHIKRKPAPKNWPIKRKEKTWTICTKPGPHGREDSLPLGLVLRDILKIAEKSCEYERMLKQKKVLVDGKAVKELAYPVGMMDLITLTDSKTTYRMLPTKKGVRPIESKDTGKKLLRITGITSINKEKFQYNFHDGRNLLLDKKKYGMNDVVEYSLKDHKITAHHQFKEGADAIITNGAKMGNTGKIEKIKILETPWANTVIVKNGDDTYETIFDYVFVADNKTLAEMQQ